jgi:hypothetical protein
MGRGEALAAVLSDTSGIVCKINFLLASVVTVTLQALEA